MQSGLLRQIRPLGLVLPFLILPLTLGAEETPRTTRLGKPIDNISLTDSSGKSWTLHGQKPPKALVAVFLSFECPMSNSYAPLLTELARTYEARGVRFVGFCCTEGLSAQDVARQTKDFGLPFPVLYDSRLQAADAFKAEVTPEVFLLDDRFVLRYRGRIDNGWAERLKKNLHITQHDLRAALDELLAGKPIHEPATTAIGCPIVRQRTTVKSGAVTYHRDVAPILQNHCQSCHRPGEVGPFALTNYRQAVNWAADIKTYTQSREMPPWKPTAGQPFHNERKLTDQQIATLAAWVDAGTPEGDPKDAPPTKSFAQGWTLGQPDLVLTSDEDFQLGPSGKDLFRCFVLPTNQTEDRYVVAVEVRPSNPRIVHHALLFLDGNGQGRALERKEKERDKDAAELDRGPGYTVSMGAGFVPQGSMSGWAPGQLGRYLPSGTAYFLPKGTDVVMQVHYHRNGRVEKDRTQIGLYFAKEPVRQRFQGLVLPGGGRLALLLTIPKDVPDHRVHGSIWVDQDFDLHSVMPHMHMIGKKIKVTLTPPDGKPETLVGIDDWNYNWQETYFFKKPIAVKAGSRFDVEAIYDNSASNPNNPNDPPKTIRFGQQTTDEMCFIFFGATSSQPGRIRPKFEAPKLAN